MSHCVIYARVSSGEQVDGMSLDFQVKDCKQYACRKRLEVAEIFREKGESAKFTKRPQLSALLEYCGKHRKTVSHLIVWKLDRLSRNQLDYYYLKRMLQDWGICLLSATEAPLEDQVSIAGKIFETFSALQAEIDNTLRSERVRRGMQAKLESGIWPWRPPLGYVCQNAKQRGEKKTRPDRLDARSAPILQLSLKEVAEGQGSQRDLARALDARGLAHIPGRKTTSQFVQRLLGDYLDFYHGFLTDPWTKAQVRGAHEPLFSDDLYFKLLGRRKSAPTGRPVRAENELFPLRSTVLCPGCGRHLTGSLSRSGTGRRYPYYHCAKVVCALYGKVAGKERLETEFSLLIERHCFSEPFVIALATAANELVADAAPADLAVSLQAVQALSRSWPKWSALPFAGKRLLQRLVFPNGVEFDREQGFLAGEIGQLVMRSENFEDSGTVKVQSEDVEALLSEILIAAQLQGSIVELFS